MSHSNQFPGIIIASKKTSHPIDKVTGPDSIVRVNMDTINIENVPITKKIITQ